MGCFIFIKVVSLKKVLYGASSEELRVLLDCLCVLPLVLVNMVKIKVVFLNAGDEWSRHLSFI